MPKQEDMLEDGEPGVGLIKDRKLDKLADEFTELRDAKAKMAEEMTALEGKIIERMQELKVAVYRYADRKVTLVECKRHVKIKTVEVGDEE